MVEMDVDMNAGDSSAAADNTSVATEESKAPENFEGDIVPVSALERVGKLY